MEEDSGVNYNCRTKQDHQKLKIFYLLKSLCFQALFCFWEKYLDFFCNELIVALHTVY